MPYSLSIVGDTNIPSSYKSIAVYGGYLYAVQESVGHIYKRPLNDLGTFVTPLVSGTATVKWEAVTMLGAGLLALKSDTTTGQVTLHQVHTTTGAIVSTYGTWTPNSMASVFDAANSDWHGIRVVELGGRITNASGSDRTPPGFVPETGMTVLASDDLAVAGTYGGGPVVAIQRTVTEAWDFVSIPDTPVSVLAVGDAVLVQMDDGSGTPVGVVSGGTYTPVTFSPAPASAWPAYLGGSDTTTAPYWIGQAIDGELYLADAVDASRWHFGRIGWRG